MLADVLMLGRERQCEVFPPFSVGKMWVVLCVGGKHRGDQAGRSRCGQENREEQQLRWLSGFDLAIPTGQLPVFNLYLHSPWMPKSTPFLGIRLFYT
jgi:hypothetical protein